MWPHILFLLYLNAFFGVRAFTTSTPTQCGEFTVNWTDGQPPFVLQILPVNGTQQVTSIPASAFSDGVGSYSVVLQLAQRQQFLVTISDATGFATRGISPLLTVQAQTSQSSNCNTFDPNPQFFFSLDDVLRQCRKFTFSEYSKAVLPATIYGLVPGGTAITLNVPNDSDEYSWNPASIAAGTQVIFMMSDAQGRTGGVTNLMAAQSTNDTSCLNANSPSVTQSSSPSTRTSLPSLSASLVRSTASSSSIPPARSSSSKISSKTLIAASVGALVFLGILAAIGVFFFRRCRKKSSRRRRASFDVDSDYHDDSPSLLPQVDPFPTRAAAAPYELSRMDNEAAGLITRSAQEANSDSPSPVHTPSASSRKENMAATVRYQPAQFIVHTDVEELTPDENGFIELPPQYSENRRPLDPYASWSGVRSSYTP